MPSIVPGWFPFPQNPSLALSQRHESKLILTNLHYPKESLRVTLAVFISPFYFQPLKFRSWFFCLLHNKGTSGRNDSVVITHCPTNQDGLSPSPAHSLTRGIILKPPPFPARLGTIIGPLSLLPFNWRRQHHHHHPK